MTKDTAGNAELDSILGYAFSNARLLSAALTHPSASARSDSGAEFERLEFLGDRALGLAIADLLYANYPDDPEGQLSRRLAALVRKETCAEIMGESGLDSFVKVSGIEQANRTAQGDACEAVIGALYLDGGEPVVKEFVARHWSERLHNPPERLRDPKSRLQEWALARKMGIPAYAVIEREGPDHAPLFTVEVRLQGDENARGRGSSKRDAEMQAAEDLLQKLSAGPDHG